MREYIVFDYKPTDKRNSIWRNSIWFELNDSSYRMVGFEHRGQIDFCCNPSEILRTQHHTMLSLDIFHNYENQGKVLTSKANDHSDIIITNVVDPRIQHKNIVFSDFLFNRTKAYYSQYPFKAGTTPWYHAGTNAYINPPLTRADNKKLIFVAACRTHIGKRIYRTRLAKLLENYKQLGHLGLGDNTINSLYSHSDFPNHSLTQLDHEKKTYCKRIVKWGEEYAAYSGYNPPHNEYYKNTFISIYGETIEFGLTTAVTEKTWDPLIKGHFILPFSNAGFIGYLQSIGIQFPDFINYSYDTIIDDEKRFAAYSDEVKRLLALDLDAWRELWDNNLHILLANKRYFYNRDYHRIDLEQLL